MNSTITGTLYKTTGGLLANANIIFFPVRLVQTATYTSGTPVKVTTDANGQFTVSIAAGEYDVIIDNNIRKVYVPNTGITYGLSNLFI